MIAEARRLAEMIKEARAVTFFGGAGVSTESGIPDFRSAKGLFHQKRSIPPETILSHSFFLREPQLFYAFYRENLLAPGAMPNEAHKALAKLEQMGKLRSVVTQNIDGLHQQAGSKVVHELHGSVARNYCMDCAKTYTADYVRTTLPLPLCSCGGLVRPDVVLYEEGLDSKVTQAAVDDIQRSDLLIVGGTSLVVYPAAYYARLCPGELVIINRDSTPMDQHADLLIRDSIGSVLKQAVEILSGMP